MQRNGGFCLWGQSLILTLVVAFIAIPLNSIQAQDRYEVTLPNRIIGRMLVLCVETGMTPGQVRKVFGRPDIVHVQGYGSCTYVSETYVRYGVTASYHNPPDEPIMGSRVDAGLQ
jgi:hypothetical protein